MGPKKVNLVEAKKYFFCTCGKSEDMVFCDGAHKECGMKPQIFTVAETKDYHLCTCKKSSNLPYCDGSHAK